MNKKRIAAAAIIMILFLCAFAAFRYFVSDKNESPGLITAVYESEALNLSFRIPGNWSYKQTEPGTELNSHSFFYEILLPVFDIYDENGNHAGAVGYNRYEEYEGAEDDPRAIYNQIALGNNYRFGVRDSYDITRETESGVTAESGVYYSASVNGGVEMINRGILSYNKNLLVYAAMEFSGGLATDGQITDIARSVEIY